MLTWPCVGVDYCHWAQVAQISQVTGGKPMGRPPAPTPPATHLCPSSACLSLQSAPSPVLSGPEDEKQHGRICQEVGGRGAMLCSWGPGLRACPPHVSRAVRPAGPSTHYGLPVTPHPCPRGLLKAPSLNSPIPAPRGQRGVRGETRLPPALPGHPSPGQHPGSPHSPG